MQIAVTRTGRVESPERWARAAQRAVAEGIEIRQLQSTGQWVATSGSDKNLAYQVDVTGAVAHGCDCLAALHGDPCCKHKAAFFVLIGAINPTTEQASPAPVDVQFVRDHSDRYQVLINGRVFGDAVATEYGGWELFRGRFPHAKRRGTFCTLDEISRTLRETLANLIPFPALAPSASKIAA